MGCSTVLTTESQFVGEGREHIVAKFQSVYWPDKSSIWVRSLGGSIYKKNNLNTMTDFVLDQNEETPEIAKGGPVWNKDHFVRVMIDVGVPTVRLG